MNVEFHILDSIPSRSFTFSVWKSMILIRWQSLCVRMYVCVHAVADAAGWNVTEQSADACLRLSSGTLKRCNR